jgi:hypothetical protein
MLPTPQTRAAVTEDNGFDAATQSATHRSPKELSTITHYLHKETSTTP